MGLILLVILILLLIGAVPHWGYNNEWDSAICFLDQLVSSRGYGPSGGVGLIFVIVLILFLMGHI